MRKKVLMLALCSVSIMTACSTGGTSQMNSQSAELEVIQAEGDRIVYYNFEDLEKAADLVVIGEFLEDTEQKLVYEYSAEYERDILVDATSYNSIKIETLLKGDVEDSTLKIFQRYGVLKERNELVTFSEMTPMDKGDKWIFFLKYNEALDMYYCAGDYTGRYPLPKENAADKPIEAYVNELVPEEFGVYDKNNINLELYREIVQHYELAK